MSSYRERALARVNENNEINEISAETSELIKELERFDGNLDVVVQYRDDGWDYPWYDEEIYLSTKDSIPKEDLKQWQKVYKEYKTVYWTDMVVVDVDRLYL